MPVMRHRSASDTFEADYYSIDARFISAVEREIASGKLQLDHHFWIATPDGRLLCNSMDDCTVITFAEDIKKKIVKQ